MRASIVFGMALLVAGIAAAQENAPAPTPYVVPVAGEDEIIVFEKPFYRGEWMKLKVGDDLPNLKDTPGGNWELRISSLKVGKEAVAVLYSSFNFQRFCLGLPGQALGGAGYYPDLAKVQNKDLRSELDNSVRSIRVLGKDTDLKTVCDPVKRK